VRYPKRSQYKYAKSRYRVRNWAEYEAGLQRRGNLTVWLSDAALRASRAPASGKPGGQRTYADLAIEAALTIGMVFHLPLRQTEGFLRSLALLLELDLPIPDHTTLSRRLPKLGEIQFHRIPTDRPVHLLIDSTGSGFMSGIYENRQREGLGANCTSLSMRIQARSSHRI
jgi:Transposase DDE domain